MIAPAGRPSRKPALSEATLLDVLVHKFQFANRKNLGISSGVSSLALIRRSKLTSPGNKPATERAFL